MPSIYLNIGSNRGNRRRSIGRAIRLIGERWPAASLRRSPWYESQAWGYESSGLFVNVGVALDFAPGTLPDPMAVLRAVKTIEQEIAPGESHRKTDGSYADRQIDIDIIAIDDIAIDSDELTVPHPRAAARDFVMKPMQFLCPGWTPASARPGLKKTIADMGRDDIASFKAKPKMPVVLVLDNIRSLNNIGSMFRTCDAFAVESIALCGISATPPAPEIHKTALGAELSVDWTYHPTTSGAIASLRERGYRICCLEQVKGSTSLDSFVPEAGTRYALVSGNEVAGVDADIVAQADLCLEIPQAGTKHSLNVAVSTAIALWHFFERLAP